MLRLRRNDREVFGLGAWIFAFFAVLLAFGALGVAANAISTSKDAKEVAAVGGAGTKVTLTEFKIDPAMITAAVDGSIAVTNGGTVEHNLAVKGTDIKTAMLQAGRERHARRSSGLKQGNYTAHLRGRRARGRGHEGDADGRRRAVAAAPVAPTTPR